MTQAQEIGCSRETLLQQTCSKQVPDGVSWMSLWEAHNPLSTCHMTWLKWLREESGKVKTGVLSARKWPHMTTRSSDSTRRRVWKHSTAEMQCLESHSRGQSEHSPVGLERPLDMYCRLLSAVFWDRESPYSNARSKSHRFTQWGFVQVLEPLSGVGPLFRRCSFTLYIFETFFAAPSFSRSLFVTFNRQSDRKILMQYAGRYE